MKSVSYFLLMSLFLPTQFILATNLDPYDRFVQELEKAAEERQFISIDDLYGHDTSRSTSGSHVKEFVLNSNGTCQFHKSGPNPFFIDKSYSKFEDQESNQCLPLLIAKAVREAKAQPYCNTKERNDFYHSEKNEYNVSISSGIDFNCLCYKKFYANTWSAIDDLLHPLNLLFNGPDYHRVTTKYALTKEECLDLAGTSEEKQAIEKAYDSKSRE